MRVRVRKGYTLHLPGSRVIPEGKVVNVKPEEIAEQSWKIEEVGARKARKKGMNNPPAHRAMTTAETRGTPEP